MDNKKKGTLPEILSNHWCKVFFAINAAIFVVIYLLVRERLSCLGYSTEPANPGTTLTPAVVSQEPVEIVHDSYLTRSLLYVIIAILWCTAWFLYSFYCCCYDVNVGEEHPQRPIDEEGAVPSEPIDVIIGKGHDQQNYLQWREAAALPVAGPGARDPQPSTSRRPTAEDIAADREAYHQAAMDLIEPIPINISFVVTVYYTEDESLMLGKSTIIQDGGLWELCIQKQNVTARDLETGHWLLTTSETDPSIVNRFLAHLNSSPSLTIFIPVKLPADFVLQGDYTRPESIGFDMVVKGNDVYYANDLVEDAGDIINDYQGGAGFAADDGADGRTDRPHSVRSSPTHIPRPSLHNPHDSVQDPSTMI